MQKESLWCKLWPLSQALTWVYCLGILNDAFLSSYLFFYFRVQSIQIVQRVFEDSVGALKSHGSTGLLPKHTNPEKLWDGEPQFEICLWPLFFPRRTICHLVTFPLRHLGDFAPLHIPEKFNHLLHFKYLNISLNLGSLDQKMTSKSSGKHFKICENLFL